MGRVAHLLLVGLLTFQVTGTLSLIVPEACAPVEASRAADDSCASTCVLCGCCAQPIVPSLTVQIVSIRLVLASSDDASEFVPTATAREILHVPRRSA